MHEISCMLMRGGTSRGPCFLTDELPRQVPLRDRLLVAALGAGHPLQVDGIGGGHTRTSKVAMVRAATIGHADVDYLFAQVDVGRRRVDTRTNCGNMLAAVAPFAIERGLVRAEAGETRVRIHNVNTGQFITATVQTPDGRVTYAGDTAIDGVPGTAAPVLLDFADAIPACGRFPTGRFAIWIDGIPVTLIQGAMPLVIIRAGDLGKTGCESAAELDADPDLLAQVEEIRRAAGALMDIDDVANAAVPKPVLVAPARRGGQLTARYFSAGRCHGAMSVTGAVTLATAATYPGTIAGEIAALPVARRQDFVIEHPGGRIAVALERASDGGFERASLVRTARKLMDGTVFAEPGAPDEPECAAP